MKRPNIALFGGGRMGKIHSNNIFIQEEAHLKYIVDQDTKTAHKLSKKFHCKVATQSQVFSDKSIDAIIITTPTTTHQEIILTACQYGKDVFCEKPLVSNLQQAKKIVKLVEKSKILFFTAFNRRFDPSFRQLKTQLDTGRIGDLLHLIIFSRDPAPPPLSYLKTSGGLVRDMMIHDLDLVLWIMEEEIEQISVIGSNFFENQFDEVGDIDHCCVMLKTVSGKVAQIINSRYSSYGYDQRIEVFGIEGKLAVGNQKTTDLELATKEGFQTDKAKNFFLERYQDAYKLEIKHFCQCVKERKQPLVSVRDGKNAIALAERIIEQIPQIKL